jgi:hypothetical protein
VNSTAQAKSAAFRAARARLRLEQLRQHSARGSTKQEAAQAIGMTVGGVDNLLYQKEGTSTWPMV